MRSMRGTPYDSRTPQVQPEQVEFLDEKDHGDCGNALRYGTRVLVGSFLPVPISRSSSKLAGSLRARSRADFPQDCPLSDIQCDKLSDCTGSISGGLRLRQRTCEPTLMSPSVCPVSGRELPFMSSDDERPVSATAEIDAPPANGSVRFRGEQSSSVGQGRRLVSGDTTVRWTTRCCRLRSP